MRFSALNTDYVMTQHPCDCHIRFITVHRGRWYPSMHCRYLSTWGGGIPTCIEGLQAHTNGGVERSGLGGLQIHTGGSPGPHLGGSPGLHPGAVSRPTPRGVFQHALRQAPPSRRLLLQAVLILLECILVLIIF